MSSQLITPPAVEPITIAQARLHLKEDTVGADIDARINLAIKAVREVCENDCRRAFISQQWKTTLDRFPSPNTAVSSTNWYGPWWGTSPGPISMINPGLTSGYECYLSRTPILSIDKIEYTDTNNVAQVLDPATMIAYDYNEGLIVPAWGKVWPGTQTRSAVSITYTAGYGTTPDAVPAAAVQWMLMNLATLYEMPQAEMVVYRETLVQSKFADRLLDGLRVRRY